MGQVGAPLGRLHQASARHEVLRILPPSNFPLQRTGVFALLAPQPLSGASDAYVHQPAWWQCLEKIKQLGDERCQRFDAVGRGNKHDN